MPALCASPLSAVEQAHLLGLLEALGGFLRSPGDWGQDTRLGRFTVDVQALRRDLAMLADDDEPEGPERRWELTSDGEIEPIKVGGTD